MPRSRRVSPSHHPPPRELASATLPITSLVGPWWRIHRSAHSALFFGKTGLYRFDGSVREFGVLYAGDSPECAFIETFGHATGTRLVTWHELSVRALSEIRVARPLRLVDLTGPGLAALGADNRLCNGSDYKVAQAWSAAIYAHPEAPDGLLYLACHDPSVQSVALYDRAAPACSEHPAGNLTDAAHTVLLARILKRYRFGLIP